MSVQHVPFADLIQQYDGFFLDSYGVLKNYYGQIEGVAESLHRIRELGKSFLIITNDASRSPQALVDHFHRLGLADIGPEQIISSGMLAQAYLRRKIRSGRVAYLGTEAASHYLTELGLTAISIQDLDLAEADDVTALVLLDDEGFDWNRALSKSLNLLRQQNIPAVVANTDATYPVAPTEVNIAIGGIADLLEQITHKRFIRFGKPDSQIFTYALDRIQASQPIDRSQILMVGDTLQTDILGGNQFGLDTALVLTGNTQPAKAQLQIQAKGIKPTYICPSLSLTT